MVYPSGPWNVKPHIKLADMNILSGCICLIDPRGTAKPRAKRRKLLTRPVEASRATLKSDAYERQAIYYHSDNPAN